jgi:hypothetical protein
MTDETKLLQTVVPLLQFVTAGETPKSERCDCYDCRVLNAADEVIEQITAHLETKELKPYHILDTLKGKTK